MFPPMAPQPEADTTTAQQVVDDQNITKDEGKPDVDPKVKKRNDEFRQRIDVCKLYRRKLISNWTVSIDYRRGKPFSSQSDEDQIAVNLDWSLTKAKQANLFSQVPQARVNHGEDLLPSTNPWALVFQKKINETLISAGIESAMDECLPDCINAAGIGVVLVSYETITKDVDVPIDPANPKAGTTKVPKVYDKHYLVQRISPADLLWPINFTGADFDNAPWMGRSGRITWAEAVQQYNLTPEDKETVLGEDRPMMDKLTHDVERDKVAADDMVGFDEIFFHEYQYDSESESYKTIHHLVYINGKTEPVVDEPWRGQKIGPDGVVVGALQFPLRVLTLAYVTDETIPPSDSAIGRAQVNEINKGRTQMIRQRERSIPVRWFDVNRIDPAIQQALMRGTWQNMIPVQGDGGRSIGEVAKATMPPETFEFAKIAMSDLMALWTLGPNQLGSGADVETKGEATDITSGVSTQTTKERAMVASFFVGIVEVLGGLLCLFEDPAAFGQGFDPKISTTLKYSVLADSTVLLDANQKIARLNSFLNAYAKTGWVNVGPVLQEIAQLSGLDPNVVIRPPEPKPPVEPNISLRLTGVEDLLNPLTLAFLMKSGQAPDVKLIEQAKQLIQQAVVPPQGMNLQPGAPGPGMAPMLPESQLPPPAPGVPGEEPQPAPAPPKIGEANEDAAALPKISDRTESRGIQ